MDEALENTAPTEQARHSIWRRLTASRYTWALAGVVLALMVVAASLEESASHTGLAGDRIARFMEASVAQPGPEQGKASEPGQRRAAAAMSSSLEDNARPVVPDANTAELAAEPASEPVPGPMIAQTASLTIVPGNYEQAAGSIGALITARGGYVQKLDADASTDSTRSVSVTLRVPAKEMEALLVDLRKLGRVESESRENEEVTDQYVDLDARLENARASERRLIELLGTRTGKLEDVLDAERELTRVRGDVESMTGERNLLLHRVDYATVEVELEEQYRAQFGSGSPAGSLRNAFVEGFRNLETGAIAALAFVLESGPSLLFWLTIFGGPAWLAWRVARRRFARLPSASNFQRT